MDILVEDFLGENSVMGTRSYRELLDEMKLVNSQFQT
jgi:hypothetical protein